MMMTAGEVTEVEEVASTVRGDLSAESFKKKVELKICVRRGDEYLSSHRAI